MVTLVYTKAVSVFPNNKRNNQNLLAHLLLKFQTLFIISLIEISIPSFLHLIFVHFFAASSNVNCFIYKLCLISFLHPDDLQNVVKSINTILYLITIKSFKNYSFLFICKAYLLV